MEFSFCNGQISKGLNFANFLNSSKWTYTHIYMKRVMNGDKMEMGKIHSKVLYGKWVICAGKKMNTFFDRKQGNGLKVFCLNIQSKGLIRGLHHIKEMTNKYKYTVSQVLK